MTTRESRPSGDSRTAEAFGGAGPILPDAAFLVRLDLPAMNAKLVTRDHEDRWMKPDAWALTWATPSLVRVLDVDLAGLPPHARVVVAVGRLQPSAPVVAALVASGAQLEFEAADVATVRAWHSTWSEVAA